MLDLSLRRRCSVCNLPASLFEVESFSWSGGRVVSWSAGAFRHAQMSSESWGAGVLVSWGRGRGFPSRDHSVSCSFQWRIERTSWRYPRVGAGVGFSGEEE